jgi:hypothetical protein
MSVIFSGTNQGRFVSAGRPVLLDFTSAIDWVWVKNLTVSYAAGAGTGAEFYWQRGMTQGRGTIYTKTATTNALAVSQIAANAGFYLVDSSSNLPGPSLALTGITAGNPPVVNTANTSSLNSGSIVRIFSTVGARQLGGLDFTIGDIVAGVSFELTYMAQIAGANPGAGTFRKIPFNPLYYPPTRYITKINQADQAIVSLSVNHNFSVGQVVRFIVPTVTASTYGMTELDGLQATIVAINEDDADGDSNTITVDIDTTGFTAFAFPLTTAPGFTPAQIVPVGENTAIALSEGADILGDATENIGYIGIELAAGANSPAGVANDIIYYVAGSSFSVDNVL